MSSHKHTNERTEAFKAIALMLVTLAIMIYVVYSLGFMEFQHNLNDARSSVEFKTVTGKIKSSEVEEYHGRSTRYVPEINYQYSVAGNTYFSNQIMFPNPRLFSSDEADVYIKRYPANRSVKVFYDPANPQRCCLEKGVTADLKNDGFYQPH